MIEIADLPPDESSNVAGLGYDLASQTLGVRFKSGPNVYKYLGVGPDVHAELLDAKSKGSFIARQIRPNHDVEVIKPQDAEQ